MSKCFFLLAFTATLNVLSQNKNSLLIKNINLINVEKGIITKDVNIYVKNGIITQIEDDEKKNKSLASDLVIDGKNKFLMPGYIDAYSLMPSVSNPIKYNEYFLLNLINGITSQIVMKYDENNKFYRDSINTNKIVGTNLFLCQPAIKSFTSYESMSKSFDDFKLKGYNQIKYVEGLTSNQFDSIATILENKKINFYGRIHNAGLGENIKVGMKNIYHVHEFDVILEKDSHSVYKLIPEICKKNIFITPTLFFHNREWDQYSKDELYSFPELKFVQKYITNFWINEYNKYDKSFIQAKNEQYTAEKKDFRRRLDNYSLMLQKMDQCHAKFLIGSDEVSFGVIGFSFHREIQLFKNANISNLSILKAITINAAESIGESSKIGSVKVNMMADMVILNSNPLDNTANLKDINAVVKFGNYYNINELQELLNKSITNDRK